MTIATKNNAIIVKDGKLAENCGCCGGWYCYSCGCKGAQPTKLYATFQLSTQYGSASLSLTLQKVSGPPYSCNAYSTAWGSSLDKFIAPKSFDYSITNNLINTSYGTQERFTGVIEIAFFPACTTYNDTAYSNDFAVVTASGVYSDFYIWWLGNSGWDYPRSSPISQTPVVVPSYSSSVSPCYADFPQITSVAGVFDSPIYYGTASLTVTGAE